MGVVKRVKLRLVGDSIGLKLPDELVEDLRLEAGAEMLVMTADEGIYLSPPGSAFKEAYDDYQRLGRQYERALALLNQSDYVDFSISASGNGNGNGNGTGRLRS